MHLSPAMKQYVEIKRKYPKSLLLFRMGDFYETFFDDAKEASRLLNITLTKRGTKQPVPLAGIPYHALDNYLSKLIKLGRSVTIIEQVEDPKLAKGRLVKREVVRTITPGTIIEGEFLDSKTNNYLMSIYFGAKVAISFVDISTGEFKVLESSKDNYLNDISKIRPSEILVSEYTDEKIISQIKKLFPVSITEQSGIYFHKSFGEEEIKDHFNIFSLSSFGLEGKDDIVSSCGALLNYLKITQKTRLKYINKINYFNTTDYMLLDIHTLKNLEILENLQGGKTNTLLETIDFTRTAMGSRLLKKNLVMPLLDKKKIDSRLALVDFLINNDVSEDLSNLLKEIPDVERVLTRIMFGSAAPRELIALREGILKSKALFDYTGMLGNETIVHNIELKIMELAKTIDIAIREDAPVLFKEGNFIKKGFDKNLDYLLDLRQNTKKIILGIEQSEREKTGIRSLRVGYNRVYGYFIEIPNSQKEKVPLSYIRKQTLVNNERYITDELKVLEDKIAGAEEKSKAIELELLATIIDLAKTLFPELKIMAENVAQIDFFNSLSLCAIERNYTKPEIVEKNTLSIIDGRHPVVELLESEKYITNNISMDDEQNNVIILTGPNMSGKSTYLRQNALIILLAHLGSYVPAKRAVIPLTDKIFTRIGAHDNLALGLSTFMVEMIETANILHNATNRSFVILDEIGRGTSTYDGLSIAWSVLEYIYGKIGAKTLFATHYHQITELENKYSGIKNYYITAKEYDNNIIFLRKVVEGCGNRSYGIAVAKLAGIPQEVIDNALVIEHELENNRIEKKNIERIIIKSSAGQKTLFNEGDNK